MEASLIMRHPQSGWLPALGDRVGTTSLQCQLQLLLIRPPDLRLQAAGHTVLPRLALWR
jgi:hypothetical protein